MLKIPINFELKIGEYKTLNPQIEPNATMWHQELNMSNIPVVRTTRLEDHRQNEGILESLLQID